MFVSLMHDAFSNHFAFNALNCFGHDCGGARHIPSVRTKAQTFGKLFLAQMVGFVWRHPAV